MISRKITVFDLGDKLIEVAPVILQAAYVIFIGNQFNWDKQQMVRYYNDLYEQEL